MLKLTAQRKRWFDVPQDPSGDCKVEILYLKPGEVSDIEAKANQVTSKQYNDSEFVTEIDWNSNELTKAFVEASVVDFKGFMDINDKPLKCTSMSKRNILKEFSWFGSFIASCRAELAEEVEADQEELEKN